LVGVRPYCVSVVSYAARLERRGNIRLGASVPPVVTTLGLDSHARSPRWRPAPWVVPLFALSGIVLVPWTVFLVRSLPSTHAAAHWDIAWAGFDIGLALLLLGVAVAGWRRSAWLEGAATAAAALLVVDAWFDVMTSSTHVELVIAIGEAVPHRTTARRALLPARTRRRARAAPSNDFRESVGPTARTRPAREAAHPVPWLHP
jgi:hypothetical protein